MDSDFLYDLDDVLKNIDEAEVLSLFFPAFRKSVVIDTRFSDTEGPLVQLMPMAASPQERMRSLRRLRSNFPRVHNMAFIPWSRYVESLITTGIWGHLVQRFKDAGHEKAVATCNSIMEELKSLEKGELAAAVRGENYHTIWSARG